MLPRSRSDERPRYQCAGRVQNGLDFCSQPSVLQEAVDGALERSLAERYFDMEATLSAWGQARAGELTLAQEAHDHAQREADTIDRRLAKVQRGWQDDVITDDDYAQQRTSLEAEREAAAAALAQTEDRIRELEQAVGESDLQPVVDALGALKAADLNEKRRIIRSLFHRIEFLPNEDGSYVLLPQLQVVRLADGRPDWEAMTRWRTLPQLTHSGPRSCRRSRGTCGCAAPARSPGRSGT
jgi:hypothetical protein